MVLGAVAGYYKFTHILSPLFEKGRSNVAVGLFPGTVSVFMMVDMEFFIN